LILLAALAVSFGAFAAPRVDPGLEPEGVEAAYRAYAEAQGRPEAARELVCRRFAERARLCFTRVEGAARPYFTRTDGQAVEALEAAARGSGAEAVKRLESVVVEGFDTPYWMAAVGDGRDHAALLHPDALRKRLGGDFVVAVPARGVLVAWVPGDLVFDKIVAVGIRRMYDTLPNAVSPLLYKWNGEAWITWGEAREVPGAMGPAPLGVPAEGRAPVPPLR
jgi:hypothetical protein